MRTERTKRTKRTKREGLERISPISTPALPLMERKMVAPLWGSFGGALGELWGSFGGAWGSLGEPGSARGRSGGRRSGLAGLGGWRLVADRQPAVEIEVLDQVDLLLRGYDFEILGGYPALTVRRENREERHGD